MAPLVQQLCQDNRFVAKVCVTGQHREMLDQVLELFSITPDFDLNIMEPGQTLNGVTSKILLGMQQVLSSEQPDVVLVHGDTATTFAASLAAYYQQIPVGHVEAGLRTGNIYSLGLKRATANSRPHSRSTTLHLQILRVPICCKKTTTQRIFSSLVIR